MGVVFSAIGLGGYEEPAHTVLVKEGSYELRAYKPRIVAEVEVEGDMTSAGSKGFRQIAGFIFGSNTKRTGAGAEAGGESDGGAGGQQSEKISMTVPVAMQQEPSSAAKASTAASESIAMTVPVAMVASGSQSEASSGAAEPQQQKWRMSFYMPSQYTLATLPRPNNPNVLIKEIPSQTFAAVVFSGFIGEDTMRDREAEVKKWMDSKQLRAREGEGTTQPQLLRYNPPWSIPFLRRNEVLVEVDPASPGVAVAAAAAQQVEGKE